MYKIIKSKISNQGLVATKDIKCHTKVIDYKGRLISKKETESNKKFDNDKHIYLFNINKKYDMDGDYRYNTARLINHSCNPNCEVTGKGLTNIIKISPVNVVPQTAVATLLEKGLDGELRTEKKKIIFISQLYLPLYCYLVLVA